MQQSTQSESTVKWLTVQFTFKKSHQVEFLAMNYYLWNKITSLLTLQRPFRRQWCTIKTGWWHIAEAVKIIQHVLHSSSIITQIVSCKNRNIVICYTSRSNFKGMTLSRFGFIKVNVPRWFIKPSIVTELHKIFQYRGN